MRPRDRNQARRTSILLLTGLFGTALAAVVAFTLGAIAAGLLAIAAGLVTVAIAAWRARPGNWPPADPDDTVDQGR